MAFMKAKGFQSQGRGAKGRFVRSPGGQGQGSVAWTMPPWCRSDMTCVKCMRKWHAASECRDGKTNKSERPCITCGKPGHEASYCPQRPSGPPRRGADVKAIEDAVPNRVAATFCVTKKPVDTEG